MNPLYHDFNKKEIEWLYELIIEEKERIEQMPNISIPINKLERLLNLLPKITILKEEYCV